ncbi:MAG: cysteine desulfurase NifS [Methanomassiliicoccales archaeon]|jgi:cysteine desulfurase
MSMAYFDNSATSKVDPRVLETMVPYFLEKYGNASSLHSLGREANLAMENARDQVAKAINALPKDVIFTSGGTESDNMAVQGFAFANKGKGNHIVTTKIEHHAILNTCRFLESQGFRVTYLPVDELGLVDLETVKEAVTGETILVSVMTANNEIGTIQPVREIAEIAQDKGAVMHTDAVQSVTKLTTDVVKDHIDMLSMSGHKFHGPKGIGALYLKKGLKIRPLVYGGGHEQGLRSSTENVPGIVGIGKAIEIGTKEMPQNVEKMIVLRDKLIERTLALTSDSFLNGHPTRRLCNNANFRFDYIDGESLLLNLDQLGICASTGSACSSKSLEPSHVLSALGLRPEKTNGSLRLSLCKFNTMEEVDHFIGVLPGVIERLRMMSPMGPNRRC